MITIRPQEAARDDAVEVVHDLRTPLMIVKSVMSMFARYWDRLDEEKRRDLLQIALDQIHVLDREIEQLSRDDVIQLSEHDDKS